MNPLTESSLRKHPQQLRIQHRVNRVLDAAAQVFAELGFEAATTNTIAERADISIGSLYQYFPNKSALFQALCQRCERESLELLDAVITPELARLELGEVVGRVVAALRQLYSTNPRLLRVLFQGYPAKDPSLPHSSFREAMVRRVERLLEERWPRLEPTRRQLVAGVCFQVADGLFDLALLCEEGVGHRVMDELKRLLLAYLEPLEREGAG
ncbi:TetR/AcrR family transcriptional regulator [Calidithermus roseus]|uniref:HTH-type transcriptional repressor KstR n=1 Tax=Calidithermus roseus TaxID=1644118 RepID=A0A399EVB2_9DEIN|nr:TetR/AcrR family transcriptional regulator [Calidithermus roseus]RIH87575.1 HTH-type transcriptional repressor KstR [Calidithermus roseus]